MENQGVTTTIETNDTVTNDNMQGETSTQITSSETNTQTTVDKTPQTPAAPDPEVARLKAALDKATHEAAEAKRRLRASQTAEEQRAEEEREKQEAIQNELKELRKQTAVASISKRVMAFVNDETVSTSIAEALYGAEDIDTAIDEFNRAWTAREKRLKLEYGRIPMPSAGDDAPKITKEDFGKMQYTERLEFKRKYPEAYQALNK